MIHILKDGMTNLGWALLIIGIIVSLIGVIGCLKFPTFYTKLHALSVSDSFGVPVSLLGLAMISGVVWTSLKILVIIFILLLTSALSTHALIKAGIRNKIPFDASTKINITHD